MIVCGPKGALSPAYRKFFNSGTPPILLEIYYKSFVAELVDPSVYFCSCMKRVISGM